MKHSYVYKLTEKSTSNFYIGYRTCCSTRSPVEDIGTYYFSSGNFKESFKKNPDLYQVEIIQVFEKKTDAYLFEQSIILSNFKSPYCVNRSVDQKSLNGTSKIFTSKEFDQSLINMSLSQKRRAKLKEKKRLRKVSVYNKNKKSYVQYCDIETKAIVHMIP